MSKFLSFSLYYTSFTPLWLSIIFIDIKSCIENTHSITTEKYSIIVILVLLLITLVHLAINLSTDSKEGTTGVYLNSIKEEKAITSEYLLSYILPLFAFDFTKWDSVVLFLIFFLILGYLCIRHSYFSVNIILEICNYNVYSCNVIDEDKVIYDTIILSHRNLKSIKGEKIFLKSLNNEYKLDVTK